MRATFDPATLIMSINAAISVRPQADSPALAFAAVLAAAAGLTPSTTHADAFEESGVFGHEGPANAGGASVTVPGTGPRLEAASPSGAPVAPANALRSQAFRRPTEGETPFALTERPSREPCNQPTHLRGSGPDSGGFVRQNRFAEFRPVGGLPAAAAASRRQLSADSFPPKRGPLVHVTLHATEQSVRVLARVGRMEPTEQARLRHAVSALLSEHGVLEATIVLDGIEGAWRED